MKKEIALTIILIILLLITSILILSLTNQNISKTTSTENTIQSSPSSYEKTQIPPATEIKKSCSSCNS